MTDPLGPQFVIEGDCDHLDKGEGHCCECLDIIENGAGKQIGLLQSELRASEAKREEIEASAKEYHEHCHPLGSHIRVVGELESQLAALQKELEAARAELDKLENLLAEHQLNAVKFSDRAKRSEAANKRLREALERIATDGSCDFDADDMADCADKALKETE